LLEQYRSIRTLGEAETVFDGENQPGSGGDDKSPATGLSLGAVIVICIVAALLVGGFIQSRGKTRWEDVAVGDCFAAPTGDQISRVERQNCDEPHGAQAFANVAATSPDDASERCFNLAEQGKMRFDSLPDDAEFSVWDDRLSSGYLCVVISPSGGLTESMLAKPLSI